MKQGIWHGSFSSPPEGAYAFSLMYPALITADCYYKGSVSFENVAVDFTRQEWHRLDPTQRIMHKDVMLETYSHLASVGENECVWGYPWEHVVTVIKWATTAV